jgi:hypothetical protein
LSSKTQTKVFERNCNDFADAAVRFLTGGEVEMPGYILENSQNALDALPKGQAALTRSVANQVRWVGWHLDCLGRNGMHGSADRVSLFTTKQVARVVMLAWGTSNRSKEEIAKREARRAKAEAAAAAEEEGEGGGQMA